MRLQLSVALVFCAAASAAGTAVPTIEESLGMKSVAGAQISPDGRYVAYTVQQANWDENDFVHADLDRRCPPPASATSSPAARNRAAAPQWSPDSRRLAFTSDRDGKRQIYLISPAGGEAALLTAEENGVGAIAWSPDGTAIAFTSTGPDAKARKDRKEKYGDFEIVGGDYDMNHLWLLKVPAEIARRPEETAQARSPHQGRSVQRRRVFLVAGRQADRLQRDPDPDLGSQRYRANLRSRPRRPARRKLLESGGPNGNPKWSPDGKEIAYTTANGQPFFFYANRYHRRHPGRGRPRRACSRKISTKIPTCSTGAGRNLFRRRCRKPLRTSFRMDPATAAIRRISGPDAFHR